MAPFFTLRVLPKHSFVVQALPLAPFQVRIQRILEITVLPQFQSGTIKLGNKKKQKDIMDQNQPKSVWLKLILPICLGVFATAIYHNAIKTQKQGIEVWIAKESLALGQTIGSQEHSKLFEVQLTVLHKDTFSQVREAIKPPQNKHPLVTNRKIEKGEIVLPSDFKTN